MKSPTPVLVSGLFPELRQNLSTLLEGLEPEEWLLPTAATRWNVKDIAAHLLGGDVGILSRKRDRHAPQADPVAGREGIVGYINRLNESWVEVARRASPRVLCDLIAFLGPQIEAYFASLDPFAMGGPVTWAGPQPAPLWFDVAREYTERWHHQQQIRDATGRVGLYETRLFAPVLDTFVRGLPYTFRDVEAVEGTLVQLTIAGRVNEHWVLRRDRATWELLVGRSSMAAAEVTLAAEDAWKIFTRGIRGEQAMRYASITGDLALASKVLELVSVIA
ncbi:MAG TPA: maleylpyruvate isomerase N-terminal domain-containing protein [Blastocatellia bacterium]|nr:maleylpyruvate isomerase N-terminal domain-containing protein [Blastocatellia bacterium]